MTVQNTPDGSLTDVRPAKGPITVRQLLTHTAGLGYNIIQKWPIKAAYDRAGIVGGQARRLPLPGFAEVAPPPRLAVLADRLAERPGERPVGKEWGRKCRLPWATEQ